MSTIGLNFLQRRPGSRDDAQDEAAGKYARIGYASEACDPDDTVLYRQ